MRHKSQSRPPGSFIICTALSQPPLDNWPPWPHNNKYFAPPRNRYCLSYPLTKSSTDRFWLSYVIHSFSKFFRPHEYWVKVQYFGLNFFRGGVWWPSVRVSPVSRFLPWLVNFRRSLINNINPLIPTKGTVVPSTLQILVPLYLILQIWAHPGWRTRFNLIQQLQPLEGTLCIC